MKEKVEAISLVPLKEDDREQFILDNQRAFKYGAQEEMARLRAKKRCIVCDGNLKYPKE